MDLDEALVPLLSSHCSLSLSHYVKKTHIHHLTTDATNKVRILLFNYRRAFLKRVCSKSPVRRGQHASVISAPVITDACCDFRVSDNGIELYGRAYVTCVCSKISYCRHVCCCRCVFPTRILSNPTCSRRILLYTRLYFVVDVCSIRASIALGLHT
jgi:hypothetical protein